MGLALILVPLAWALVTAAIPSNRIRPWILPLASGSHLILVSRALEFGFSEWEVRQLGLALDPLGKVFLVVLGVMHFLCMLYAPGYLTVRQNRSNRVLCSCMLFSLSMMTLVVTAHHLGLMWVAVEATTLATAPGIYFNHNPRSIEATWKYLLICSVGIALALLGSFFLAYSALYVGEEPTLLLEELLKIAPKLSPDWLQAAFILLLVGYGTKMGLSPVHTWKPDAYGEAPGLVGALMSGGVTNCAFFALLRFYHICDAGGQGDFARRLLVLMGLISVATAAAFMIRQRDFKRLLAYSSVEHMGILVFGVGIGGAALFGALLHVVNNAMTKGVLFLAAGNIHRAFKSKLIENVHGSLAVVPLSSGLLFAGFIAGCGSPPFAPFVSELTIIIAAFEGSHYIAVSLLLLLLAIVFIGMGTTILSVVFGEPTMSRAENEYPDSLRTVMPIFIFMAIVCVLGVYLPAPLRELLQNAAQFLQPGAGGEAR